MARSYADPQKQRWHRVAGLVAIDRLIPSMPVSLRRVVYLDTREALQTIAYLDHGYAPENLLAMNRQAVELALLTQRLDRLGYLRVCTKTGDFAPWGLGPVDVLDFDGTSNMAGEVGDVLLTNAAWGATPKVLSFAILVGRENQKAMDTLRTIRENHSDYAVPLHTSSGRGADEKHWTRLKHVLIQATGYGGRSTNTCIWHVRDWQWGIYRSTAGQTMAWMAARLEPHRVGSSACALIKSAPSWLKRAYRYGLAPSCVMAEIGRMGDGPDGLPARVTALEYGCPSWTDDQFRHFGFADASRNKTREEFTAAEHCGGWPQPRSIEVAR